MSEKEIPDFISTAALARWLGVCSQTLRKWRQQNFGPPFIQYTHRGRGKVFYSRKDVGAWLERRRTTTTGEDDVGK